MNEPHPKIFNTVGACVPADHYMLPVLPRLDVSDMIKDKFYFILHAPRQSGKTTYIEALTNKINEEGNYYALYCELSPLSGIKDVEVAVTQLVDQVNIGLSFSQVEALKKKADTYGSITSVRAFGSRVRILLNAICRDLDKELIVFFDEADCLGGPALVTFLTQIRAGYLARHQPNIDFPRSMALVGMRDIRDYLVQVRPDEASTGIASPFNIKKESLTLANFTCGEIHALYNQHTKATGQKFTGEAIHRAWHWTEGQPWLANALAYEIVVKQLQNDYSKTVTDSSIDQAAETLIRRRDTHIDSLLERLKEPRVRRVIEPIIVGDDFWNNKVSEDDIRYAVDLGLIKQDKDGLASPANPIYGEVIIRTLTQRLQTIVPKELVNRWTDGIKLDMTALLKGFQQFWRENSEILEAPHNYKESTPHLVCFAFLQRVLNGEAESLTSEYALGRRRLDIDAKYKGVSYPVELKVKRKGQFSKKKAQEALDQLCSYMDKLGAEEGWLVIFDRDVIKSWDKKIYWDTKQIGKLTIHVVGC
ncbi:MAG: ATP-binding protein [Deltaproteobacteria bacterium]|jgi:hypothetical protein|nr:ATP-binding protein [Deltaproteobacteria bacterium]